MVDFSLCFSLTFLNRRQTKPHWTLIDLAFVSEANVTARNNWALKLAVHCFLFSIKLTSRNNKLVVVAYYPYCFA